MAKKSKKKMSIKDKMSRSIKTEKEKGSSYGYLKLLNGVPVYKAAPGTSNIRFDIMPYTVTDAHHPDRDADFEIATPGEIWYRRPFKIHRNVGTNNETIVCPTSFGQRCPICEARIKRISEGAEKEEQDTMKTSNRDLYVVIPKKSKEFEEKPHIWDFSYYNFEKLLRKEVDEDPDFEEFWDLENGLTIKARFDSATVGKGKPFAQADKVDFLARDEEYDESILETIPNLDEVLTCKSYKEIEALWFELDGEVVEEDLDEDLEEEEEEEEVKPKRKQKAAKKAPKVVEEEDEDGEDEDEEEEEEEKPKKKKGKKNKKKPEPEEEEEVEEEETAAEIKARMKKKAKDAKDKIAAKGKGKKDKCPFGHKFGKDCEDFDDCNACELWEDCSEAQEE